MEGRPRSPPVGHKNAREHHGPRTWIDSVVTYLVAEGVTADQSRLRQFAAEAFERLRHHEPAEVAEAEWQEWPAE